MSDKVRNLPSVQPDAEQQRLKAAFDELRKNQLTSLNEAGKRIIELSTGMLGVLFAVIAFGKDFPPPYLNHPVSQILAVFTLGFFFLALAAGFLCVQPQEYRDYPHNLKGMQDELAKFTRWKARCFQIGSILFCLGAFWLAGLIATIILIPPR